MLHTMRISKRCSVYFGKADTLTLIQPGKGRFTLAYMSHDYLHGSHAGLPSWIRVNNAFYEYVKDTQRKRPSIAVLIFYTEYTT